jgi:thymidylate synthase ThyX
MKVTITDFNRIGTQGMLDALGICRGKKCTTDTLNKAMNAKPVPHMSVLEFGWACMLVEGVSVKTRIQVLRSRLFSTMERSTRSIDMRYGDFTIPETVNYKDAFQSLIEESMESYLDRVIDGTETLEDASYILPLAIETSFYMAANLRVWYEYFQKRLCKEHVQHEHYRLAMKMWDQLCELYPIMQGAHPCKECGVCRNET